MELGLSLGDASKPLRFLKENKPANKTGLDFCMALGLSSPAISGNQQREKTHKTQANDQDKDGDGDDEDGDDDDDGDESDDDDDDPNLQLNLLPLAPIPLQICSRPWSSDNGSSENGSSGNLGIPAARGFDVNKLPAAGEEVSSANSPFSLYRNTRNGNLQLGGGGNKRDLEATLNDAARALSDDDENALNARKKLRLSKEQSAFLEESFKEHNTLNPKQKLALAKQLNLRPRQVEVWFQNRRARTKLKQTEVDCEYLKRCCETLTEENRRLNKELQELRALKTSNPFYMQLPATTLTMCPSCERVTTAAKTAAAAADSAAPKAKAASPFPLTRPRFYPFSQSPTSPNQPAPS